MNADRQLRIIDVAVKTAIVHTVTYALCGLIAFNVFNYSAMLANPTMSVYMRNTSDPIVRAGLLFQPLRGILFGLVFFLLRDPFFRRKNGWLTIWATLVVIGIFSTFAPASGSIEGLIYMKAPPLSGWGGMVEILVQSLLLSLLTYFWVAYPERKWQNWVLGIAFAIFLILPVLGLLAGGTGR